LRKINIGHQKIKHGRMRGNRIKLKNQKKLRQKYRFISERKEENGKVDEQAIIIIIIIIIIYVALYVDSIKHKALIFLITTILKSTFYSFLNRKR
jgi:hypothetical protein